MAANASEETTPSSSSSAEALNPVAASLIIAEYQVLREEILEHMRRDGQILSLTVLALGTLLAGGVQFHNAALMLLYPIVATALAFMWVAEDQAIEIAGSYIYTRIEGRLAGIDYISWEHFVRTQPSFKRRFRISLFLLYGTSELVSLIIAGAMSADIQRAVRSALSGHFGSPLLSSDTLLFALATLGMVISLFILVPRAIHIPSGHRS